MNSSQDLLRSLSNASFTSEMSTRLNEQVAYIKSNFHKKKQELLCEFENQAPAAVEPSRFHPKATALFNKLQDSNRSKIIKLSALKQQLSELKTSYVQASSPNTSELIQSYKTKTEVEEGMRKRLMHILRREEKAHNAIVQSLGQFDSELAHIDKMKSAALQSKLVARTEERKSKKLLRKYKNQQSRTKRQNKQSINELQIQRKLIDDKVNTHISSMLAHDFVLNAKIENQGRLRCLTQQAVTRHEAMKQSKNAGLGSLFKIQQEFQKVTETMAVPFDVDQILEKWETARHDTRSLEIRYQYLCEQQVALQNQKANLEQEINSLKSGGTDLRPSLEETELKDTEQAKRAEAFIIKIENLFINMLFKACTVLKLVKKVGEISAPLLELYNNSAKIYKSLNENTSKRSPHKLKNFTKRAWAFALTNLLMQRKLDRQYLESLYTDQGLEQAAQVMNRMNPDIYQYIPLSKQEITDSFLSYFPNRKDEAEKLATTCSSILLVSHILNQAELEDCVCCDDKPNIKKITFRVVQEASEQSRCLMLSLLETNKDSYGAVNFECTRIKEEVVQMYSMVPHGKFYIEMLQRTLEEITNTPRYIKKYRERLQGHKSSRFVFTKPSKFGSKTPSGETYFQWGDDNKRFRLNELRDNSSRKGTMSRTSTRSKVSSKTPSDILSNIRISFL